MRALLVCLLMLLPPVCWASSLSFDVNLACVHTESVARQHLNQRNPGIGLTDTFSPDWSASVGFYRNSFDRTSVYALANWLPLRLQLPVRATVRAGLTAGLLSGYTQSENPLRPFAAGALVQLRTERGWGINLVGVPNHNGASGFVGVQVVAPF